MMGGELRVESVPGEGSCFCFTLPLPLAEAPASALTHGRVLGLAAGTPAVRVLVADDQPENRELILRWLQLSGFEVRPAANGQEAVERFQAWRPHLIWMDMSMPVMDGYEATRRIRALPGGGEVRIAALTASAFEEDRAVILAAGCDEVVAKPMEEQQLFAVMGGLLGLRYRYEEAPEPAAGPPAELDLSPLPASIREELREAAVALDPEAAHTLIAGLRADHPELARGLAALVDAYRFDRLAELCNGAR